MINFYQMENITTREVVFVDNQINCLTLCGKANTVAGKIIFRVVPATPDNVSRKQMFGSKTIYSLKQFHDLHEQEEIEKRVSGMEDEPENTMRTIDAEIVDEDSPKERIRRYLLICPKRIKNKKKKNK